MQKPRARNRFFKDYICPTCGAGFFRYKSQIQAAIPTCSRRCNGIARTGMRSAHLNHEFFDVIDTHDKAYILGLAFADGNVSKSLKRWCIDLHERDESLLQETAKTIGIKTKSFPGGRCKRLEVRSDKQARRLSELGCLPNKTYVHGPVIFPKGELERSFWRGFFDGDGSIDSNMQEGLYNIKICSSHPVLTQRLKTISSKLSLFYQEQNVTPTCRQIVFNGPDAQKFAIFIQDVPGIRMHRKAVLCKHLIGLKIRRRVTRKRTPEGKRWCNKCEKFLAAEEFYEPNRCKLCSRKRALAFYHRHTAEKALASKATKA